MPQLLSEGFGDVGAVGADGGPEADEDGEEDEGGNQQRFERHGNSAGGVAGGSKQSQDPNGRFPQTEADLDARAFFYPGTHGPSAGVAAEPTEKSAAESE